MHDDTQVARVYEMKTALADGMFPVRWVPDLGYNYGYPIFNFYAPLAYYVGGFFNIIGFDSLVATKIMISIGTLLAGVSMYLLAKEFWGKFGGIVSAILYMYAPYHALNIYVRGAIGELWAYGILPLLFYSSYKLFQTLETNTQSIKKSKIKNQKKSICIWTTAAAFSYAAIIVSHNLTGMMVTPFYFIFIVLLYIVARRNQTIGLPLFIPLSFLLGIFLSAFYWVPVLFEMKFTNVLSVVGGGSDYRDHFVCAMQLWDSPWGFAGSVPGCVDGMSFKIGKLHIVLGLFSLVALILLRKQKVQMFAIIGAFLACLLSILLTIENSKLIWDAIPHLAFFQFPWRFLVLVSFFISFLSGAILFYFKKSWMRATLLTTIIVLAVFYHYGKLFVPGKVVNKSAQEYTAKSELTWNTSKISDEYMPPEFQKPLIEKNVPERKITENNGIKMLSYQEKTKVIHAEVVTDKKVEMLVNLAYFPGWHVYIDNKQDWFKHFGKGLLVTVPQGKHTIDIVFLQTPVEQIANAISFSGVFILLAGIISSRKERKSV